MGVAAEVFEGFYEGSRIAGLFYGTRTDLQG